MGVSGSLQLFTSILTWRFGRCGRALRRAQSDGGQSPETFPPITLVPARGGILGRRFVPSLVIGLIGQLTCYTERVIQITVSVQVRSHRSLAIYFADVPNFCKGVQRMMELGITRWPNQSLQQPLAASMSPLEIMKTHPLQSVLAPASGA